MENQLNVGDQNAQQIGQKSVSQPLQISEKPKVNYWIISIIVLFILLLVAGGVFYLLKPQKKQSTPQNFEQKTAPSTSLSPVNLTNISIVYAYNQYDMLNNDYDTKVFKTDYNNQNKAELNIGFFLSTSNTDPYQTKGYLYKTTPDGKYLFRISRIFKSIEAASAQLPNSFRKLVEISQGNIHNLSISPSGNEIAYIVRNETEGKLFIMNIDEGEQRFIKTIEPTNSIEGFNAKNNQIFLTDEILALNEDGTIKSVQKNYIPGEQPQFSSGFDKAYYRFNNYTEKTEGIIEYDIVNKKEKVIYKINDQQDQITSFILSPVNDMLLFEQEDLSNNKRILYSISLPEGKADILINDLQYYGLVPALCGHHCFGGSNAWSPDGKYILLEGVVCTYNDLCKLHEGEVYLIDINSKKMSLFFKPNSQVDQAQPQKQIKDSLEFIGWLAQ